MELLVWKTRFGGQFAKYRLRSDDPYPLQRAYDNPVTKVHLEEENSQLVAQNQRLLSELENTSQQLLHANSKVHIISLSLFYTHVHTHMVIVTVMATNS